MIKKLIVYLREFKKKIAADRQLQYGVAQEFQPLVVRHVMIPAIGGMRQCRLQQVDILEFIAELSAKRFHGTYLPWIRLAYSFPAT